MYNILILYFIFQKIATLQIKSKIKKKKHFKFPNTTQLGLIEFNYSTFAVISLKPMLKVVLILRILDHQK